MGEPAFDRLTVVALLVLLVDDFILYPDSLIYTISFTSRIFPVAHLNAIRSSRSRRTTPTGKTKKHRKMSFPKAIPSVVREIRLHLCQTSQASQGLR